MIIVVSSIDDLSTTDVLRWLHYYDEPFIRVNENEPIEVSQVVTNNGLSATLKFGDKSFSTDEIKSVWFRRGYIQVNNFHKLNSVKGEPQSVERGLMFSMATHSIARQEILNQLLHQSKHIKTIGRNTQGRTNKVVNLHLASSVGLKIPKTAVISTKKDLIEFIKSTPQGIITKSFDLNFFGKEIEEQKLKHYHQYTAVVDLEDTAELPDEFELTLFQEKLIKSYEIRTFFICGQFYSYAIFSQGNRKTAVDSRNYDYMNMNRVVPFALPAEIKEKVKTFMRLTNYETGSIDFVKDGNGEFVFLEMNPVGQFGHVSVTCNYDIEQAIAKTLMNGK